MIDLDMFERNQIDELRVFIERGGVCVCLDLTIWLESKRFSFFSVKLL